MTKADILVDTKKARKLIKEAEKRAAKIRKRCQQRKSDANEAVE